MDRQHPSLASNPAKGVARQTSQKEARAEPPVPVPMPAAPLGADAGDPWTWTRCLSRSACRLGASASFAQLWWAGGQSGTLGRVHAPGIAGACSPGCLAACPGHLPCSVALLSIPELSRPALRPAEASLSESERGRGRVLPLSQLASLGRAGPEKGLRPEPGPRWTPTFAFALAFAPRPPSEGGAPPGLGPCGLMALACLPPERPRSGGRRQPSASPCSLPIWAWTSPTGVSQFPASAAALGGDDPPT